MDMCIASEGKRTTADYLALEALYGASNYQPADVVLSHGEGVHVWDVDGNRYLDCLSAYSAVNQGHCHPKILEAMIEQAGRLTLTSRAFRNDQLGLFYEEICKLTRATKVLPMNSGAEAVETALKVARKWGYEVKGVPEDQAEIIVCSENFHGRTLAIVGFSSDEDSQRNFRAIRARVRDRAVWRCGCLRLRHYAQHCCGIAGADTRRGRRDHSARRVFARRTRGLHGGARGDDFRRDPDRLGPHRKAAGGRA